MPDILVVEDERIVAKDIKRSLERLGYAVRGIASSGEEAIAKAFDTYPDLVLMDIVLKGEIDGVEAAERIREHLNIPVVYLTAYGDDATLERAKLTTPFGYILKPFEERELRTTIEIALYKHQVEQKLKQSEKWLATTLRSIGDAVIATDETGNVVFMNGIAETLTGWKQTEVVGQHCTNVFRIEDEHKMIPAEHPVARALTQGSTVVLGDQFTLITKDGLSIHIDDSAAPIKDDQGKVLGTVLVFRDIAERKLAEKRFAIQYEISRILAKSTPVGEVLTRILQVICEGLGWKTGELWALETTDNTLLLAHCWNDGSLEAVEFETSSRKLAFPPGVGVPGRVWASERPIWIEDVVRDANFKRGAAAGNAALRSAIGFPIMRGGSVVAVMVFLGSAMPPPEEETLKMMSTVAAQIGQFIERKNAEEALKESEERYRIVAETASESIITIEEGGTILFVNKAGERMFGYDNNDMVGQDLTMLVPENLQAIYHGARKMYQATGRAEHLWKDIEFAGRHRSGREIPLELSFGEFTKQGQHMYTAIIRDITERKRLEDERHRLEEQLFQAQKMESVGTLAGGVAHDFNNLLTAILGNLELLKARMEPDAKLQQLIREIEHAADQSAVLVRQLLTFGRRQNISRRPIDINEGIRLFIKMLRRIIGEDIEIHLQLERDLPPAFADPTQLEQVIMNLAVNARDAMPTGGALTIETRTVTLDDLFLRAYSWATPGRYIQITVSDTGVGMDEQTRNRAFDAFFTTKEAGKGTGLGLTVVYGIIRQHEGFIRLFSELGAGTSFKIYLPAAREAVSDEDSAKEFQLKGGREVVLIAEDEEVIRTLTQKALMALGYTVLLARDGREAVELYAQRHNEVDLLLLDVVMPRMGGLEVYDQIRRMGSSVPIIFITGYNADMIQTKFSSHTNVGLLQKPYTVTALGHALREVLDRTNDKQGY